MPKTAKPADEVVELKKALVRELVTDIEGSKVAQYAATMATYVANAQRLGTFKRWSGHNRLLVEGQRRKRKLTHLGLYAGCNQWERLERVVNEDAVGLMIYVPVMVTDEQDNEAKLRGFTRTKVFDYTDTTSTIDGWVEPDWDAPLVATAEVPAALERLVQTSLVPVVFADRGAKLDRSSFDGTTIVVDASAPLGNQISALLHQLAHVKLGHTSCAHTLDEEADALIVQWLATEMIGVGGADVSLAKEAVAGLSRWVEPKTNKPIAGHKLRFKLFNTRLDEGLCLAEALVAEARGVESAWG